MVFFPMLSRVYRLALQPDFMAKARIADTEAWVLCLGRDLNNLETLE